MNKVGLALENQGRYQEAEEMFQLPFKLRKKKLGNEHPDTLWGARIKMPRLKRCGDLS